MYREVEIYNKGKKLKIYGDIIHLSYLYGNLYSFTTYDRKENKTRNYNIKDSNVGKYYVKFDKIRIDTKDMLIRRDDLMVQVDFDYITDIRFDIKSLEPMFIVGFKNKLEVKYETNRGIRIDKCTTK